MESGPPIVNVGPWIYGKTVSNRPTGTCFKIRVGACEWTHTMRATDDAELHTRVQAFVPTFRAVVAALDALQAWRRR
jgi:hypothetical protein